MIKSTNQAIDSSNPFFKRTKPIVVSGNTKNSIVKDNQGSGPFSKLELFLDKDNRNSIGCQVNNDPDKIFIVLKIKKPLWKNKKSK